MTTILADREGGKLYFDSGCSDGVFMTSIIKGGKVEGKLFGVTGDVEAFPLFEEFLYGNAEAAQGLKKLDFSALVLDGKRRLHWYENSIHPAEVIEDYMAVGTGAYFAMAGVRMLQACGMKVDARRVMEVVAGLDINTRGPFFELCLDD